VLSPNIALAPIETVMVVVAGILMQRKGRRPWIGGGVLVSEALHNLRYAPHHPGFWRSRSSRYRLSSRCDGCVPRRYGRAHSPGWPA
jgi:hypothetical protein